MGEQLTFDQISPRLPTRYEDLDEVFRGSLRPNQELISLINSAFKSIRITGGIRFLPIYGLSGSGKSCATLELGTHLPEISVIKLDREIISNPDSIAEAIKPSGINDRSRPLVAVIDQFEETAAGKEEIPTRFVEKLASLDATYRDRLVVFAWLTTSKEFQRSLVEATSRRSRILVSPDFSIEGPAHPDWPDIVGQTFSAHNSGKELADFEILETTVKEVADTRQTLGQTIEAVADKLASYSSDLQNLSDYQVIMLWPVTDGQRIQTVNTFSSPRQGYKINWHAFYNQLNSNDKSQLPLSGLNKARLYFDVRLVPIAAADLQGICDDFTKDTSEIIQSYINRFSSTHFVSIISGKDGESFSPLRERPQSQRGSAALIWYKAATRRPTEIGRMIAGALKRLGYNAKHEITESSPYSQIRADVFLEREKKPKKVIVELKAYSPENTRPSDISSQIRITLTRHARFAGFIERQ